MAAGDKKEVLIKINKKLHRREHVLADDLCRQMGEPKRFAAYLGIAMRFSEDFLRRVASEVMDSYQRDREGRTHPGRLFFYKVGEYAKNSHKPGSDSKKKSARTRAGRNKSRVNQEAAGRNGRGA